MPRCIGCFVPWRVRPPRDKMLELPPPEFHMIVHVRLFAMMAQDAGTARIDIELPQDAPLSALSPALRKKFPAMRWPPGTMLALNQEYVANDSLPLHDRDELAIIPPVSGG